MIMQGKIKSIPVKEVTEGMQVIRNTFLNEKGIIVYIITNQDFDLKNPGDFKILVVEYVEYLDYEEISEKWYNPVTKQLPLKYSQWQSVVDNKLLHTDVEFAKVGRGGEREAEIIIPTQKKRMYSEEEVITLLKEYEENRYLQALGEFITKKFR